MPKVIMKVPAADPVIVKMITDHLVAAFNQFLEDFDGEVDYVDGFMGAHNFHKAIVFDIAEATDEKLWLDIAAHTFEEAIERYKKKNR